MGEKNFDPGNSKNYNFVPFQAAPSNYSFTSFKAVTGGKSQRKLDQMIKLKDKNNYPTS